MPQDEFKSFSKEFRDGLKNVIMDEYIPAFNLYINEYAKKQAENSDNVFKGMTQIKKYKREDQQISKTQNELDEERRLETEAKILEKSVDEVKQEKIEDKKQKDKIAIAAEKRKISIQNTQSNKPKETYRPK